MQIPKEQIEQLWHKYLHNEATPAEVSTLLAYIDAAEGEQLDFVAEGLAGETPASKGFVGMDATQKAELVQQWQAMRMQQPAVVRQGNFAGWRKWAAAAALLVMASGAYLWMKRQHAGSQQVVTAAVKENIQPGQQGAILILADGRKVVLDSLGNAGVIATENGTKVLLENGKLSYNGANTTTGAMLFNTMQTPRGRQFQLTLPDGTRVWMNSGSQLRYPTAFAGRERLVELTGEAYFEVAQDAHIPFKVSIAGKAAVEVLGTAFNVSAYANELWRTTLLQGSVRVLDNYHAQTATVQNSVVLKPMQQAVVTAEYMPANLNKSITVYSNVNTDKILAWKNGLFNFDGLSLQEAMQQLERWYDIEVVYENGIPEIPFGGEISRNVSFDGLLKMLTEADLKFRVEQGRKLVIIK
ncbi:FecR family protein [Filimonas lacunae]|uniref:FecR family protein n=1 Tax=Filimonas lacunae TaxID=477680 RepID=A0A173MCU6_9BACT|nr:FecR family protein [Filimonas lacunae]BAV05375.1 anti-sigma factor [Filimonas lacunae]SIT21640.1 FecR family protein [Filimonas lacunae]